MTIVIPTGDLTGILADVIPFASADKEDPTLNTVRLEWDGELLHAYATDRFRIAWSQWSQDDEPDGDAQDDLFTTWGGADEPWSLVLPLADVKDIVSNYKLGPKEARVPLTVDVHNGQIKIVRSRDTGHSAITMAVQGLTLVEYPDLRKILQDSDVASKVSGLAYSARFLADFAKVRQRGAMELLFTGEHSLTHVAIGKRFIGAIMPTRLGDRETPAAESVGASS